MQNFIRRYFDGEVSVKSVPKKMIDHQEKSMLFFYNGYAEYYGMELEELLGYEGFSSIDEFTKFNRDENESTAKYYLVVQAIAEDAGFSVNDNELVDFFYKFDNTRDFSEFVEQYGIPYLKQFVLCEKVMDYIIDNAILK